MTIEHESAAQTARRPRISRPLALLLIALLAASLAGVTARAAFASTKSSYLTSTRSLDILRAAYGAAAGRQLREPRVVVAPTSAATWDLSDKVNMANGAVNPTTGRAWSPSDAKAMWPDGLDGFTNPVSGEIYINAKKAFPSTVPHELLHANAAPEFLLRVGVAVNEGITEQLALDALAASGTRAEKRSCYPQERQIAAALAERSGRDLLVRAYFNGGADLDAFVGAVGASTLDNVKNTAAAGLLGQALRMAEAA